MAFTGLAIAHHPPKMPFPEKIRGSKQSIGTAGWFVGIGGFDAVAGVSFVHRPPSQFGPLILGLAIGRIGTEPLFTTARRILESGVYILAANDPILLHLTFTLRRFGMLPFLNRITLPKLF
jgi:hypothetical protein